MPDNYLTFLKCAKHTNFNIQITKCHRGLAPRLTYVAEAIWYHSQTTSPRRAQDLPVLASTKFYVGAHHYWTTFYDFLSIMTHFLNNVEHRAISLQRLSFFV